MNILFKKCHPDAIIPQYQTDGSAGFDLHAVEKYTIHRGKIGLIRTGLMVELPKPFAVFAGLAVTDQEDILQVHFELQVRPRSGLAGKGFSILNSPGTIDADYRGEIKILAGFSSPWFEFMTVEAGDRVAQGIVNMIVRPVIKEVSELSETKRGSGGFGSTGV